MKNSTFQSRVLLLIIGLIGFTSKMVAQCDCPSDNVLPVFSGDSVVTIDACNPIAFPYLTATDNCDDSLEMSMTMDTLSNEYCGVHSVMSYSCAYPTPWSLGLFSMPNTQKFYRAEDLGYRTYDDGTAHLYGTVVSSTNPNAKWLLDVWLENKMDWAAWSTQQSSSGAKGDCDGIIGNKETWLYYKVKIGSKATGLGDLAGSHLNLVHSPASGYFGFQEGVGANNTSAGYGIGGWISYTGTYVNSSTGQSLNISGAGDISGEMACCSSPEIQINYTALDNCGNLTPDQQIISVRDHNFPVLTNTVPTETEVLCEDYQPWFAEWADECSAVTASFIPHYPSIFFTGYDECGNSTTIGYSQSVIAPLDSDCQWFGCTIPNIPQYDPLAIFDDGTCYMEYLNVIVFNDLNGNGMMDGSEIGIPNIGVHSDMVNADYYTSADGTVEVPYHSSSNDNVIRVLSSITSWTTNTTNANVSFTSGFGPPVIYFGLRDITPNSSISCAVSPAQGLCGSGEKTFYINLMNDGTTTLSNPQIELTLPANSVFVSSDVAPAQVNGTLVTLEPGNMIPGQSTTIVMVVNFPSSGFNLTTGDVLNFDFNSTATSQNQDLSLAAECDADAQMQLFSDPVGEGSMHYVNDGNNLRFSFIYKNNSATDLTDPLMAITIPAAFDLTQFELIQTSREVSMWIDNDQRRCYLHFTNSILGPGEEIFVQYMLQAPNATSGALLTQRVLYSQPEGEELSNTVNLHIKECLQDFALTQDSDGCAGSINISASDAMFDEFVWNVNGEETLSGVQFSFDALTPGEYVVTASAENALCTATDNITISIISQLPLLELIEPNVPLCEGASLTIEALSNQSELVWTVNGVTQTSGTSIQINSSSEIEVQATDPLGCGTSYDMTSIEALPTPNVSLIADNEVSFCEGESVTVTSTSNTDNYTFTINGVNTTTGVVTIEETSELHIEVTNACGFANSSLDIEVFPLPTATVTINSLQQALSASTGVSYQWYFNGMAINGATNAVYAYTQSGNYTVEVTNANGCSDMSTSVNVTYIGIGENSAAQLSVYPNPVQDKLILIAGDDNMGQTFVVRDVLGQVVTAFQKITQRKTEVNTGVLTSGIYFLELSNGSSIRFVVD
jgi:hypothetical protein